MRYAPPNALPPAARRFTRHGDPATRRRLLASFSKSGTILGALLFHCIVALTPVDALGAGPPGRSAPAEELRRATVAIEQGRFAEALPRLEALARAGVPQARTRLGELHYLGRGVPESDATAYTLFSEGAGGGDPAAMFWLGRMHLLGHAPAGDASEADRDAARWFFEAARRGHAEAQYYLGILFMAGTGVQMDEHEAQKWMRRAAAAGHAAAQQFVERPPGRR